MNAKLRRWLSNEFFAIESNPSYSTEEKIGRIIYATAGICGVVAMQPLPFADIFALTPIQCYMGYKIARIRGINLAEEDTTQTFKSIAGAVGMGFLAQQGAIGLYKIGLPFLGGFMTFPLVAGMTVGIGKAMDLYFHAKSQGRTASSEDLKKAYKEGKSEGKNVPRPQIPSNSPSGQPAAETASAELPPKPDVQPVSPALNPVPPPSVTSSGAAAAPAPAPVIPTSTRPLTKPAIPKAEVPSAIPPKRVSELQKHYSVYFPNVEFESAALVRILQGNKSDQLTLERQFRKLSDGILEPKCAIVGTDILEGQAGDDLRIYYKTILSGRKRLVILVGNKKNQKADLRRIRNVH